MRMQESKSSKIKINASDQNWNNSNEEIMRAISFFFAQIKLGLKPRTIMTQVKGSYGAQIARCVKYYIARNL